MSVNSKDWYAWLNTMPPKPDDFHVTGKVEVGNPGMFGTLIPASPQGINPDILILDLYLEQKPGGWQRVNTWVEVRYDTVIIPDAPSYSEVTIWCEGEVIAHMPVDMVS